MSSVSREELKDFEAFHSYSQEELEALASVLTATSYEDSQVICRQGEPGQSCFFLLSGSVRVERIIADVGTRVMGTLTSGAIFGQISLIDGGPRVTTCRSVGRSRVATLDGGEFRRLFQEGSAFAVHFQAEVARALVHQLRLANQRLTEIDSSPPGEMPRELLEGWLESVMADRRNTLT